MNVSVDSLRVWVEGVEGLDNHNNDNDDTRDGQANSDRWYKNLERRLPTDVRVSSAHQSLGKEEVDYEQDHRACSDKHLSRDRELDVSLMI